MPLPKDWRAFIESLNSNKVEYLIVGAVALAHHGFPRYTGDLDILVRRTADNTKKIEAVLAGFGFGALGLKASDFSEAYQVIQLGVVPNRIDLLTSITGVSFEDAWQGRVDGDLEGLPVAFIGRLELIRNKKSSDRAQDRADLELLESNL